MFTMDINNILICQMILQLNNFQFIFEIINLIGIDMYISFFINYPKFFSQTECLILKYKNQDSQSVKTNSDSNTCIYHRIDYFG